MSWGVTVAAVLWPAAQESQESSGEGADELRPENGNASKKAESPPAKPSQAAGVASAAAHIKTEAPHEVRCTVETHQALTL